MKISYSILIAAIVSLMCSCGKDDNPVTNPDTVAPTLTLKGKNPDTLIVKTAASYPDPGATATDDRDGDISSKIVVASNVNVSTVGQYVIYYNVEDNTHNPAERQTRVVEVVKADGTYDATSTCIGNSTNSVTIVSYSNNDSVTVNNFYSAGTVIKAGLNNYKFVAVPYISASNDTITGNMIASGTTLNGDLTLKNSLGSINCTSTFIRH